MKRLRGFRLGHILSAALAVSLLAGPAAVQARDHDRDHDRRSHDHRDDRRDHRRWDRHDHRERHAHRHDDRRWRDYDRDHRRHDRHDYRRAYVEGYRHGRFDAGRYYRPSGYRTYAWHRGARLPAAYCAPRYIVHDYADYRLYRPPHGHHWVRVDHDVVLAAVATGAVVAVVNNLFY